MKYFLSSVVAFLIILGLFIGYKQNVLNSASLPYDDEQNGLNEQVIIHFSHVVAENTPKGLAVARFAELVHEKTDGRVLVQVYPNGILYHDNNEFEALMNNEIQMIAPTFSKMTSYLPSWQVLDLPFLIETEEQLQQVLQGPLKDELLQQLNLLNIKGLDFWHNGFKQIAANKSLIQQVEDFEGLPIRVMASPVLQEQFTLLGAKPIQTTFGDVFYEIENETILAQENTISNLHSKGFHQYEKHITLSNHGILGYAVMMNGTFWRSLDPELQQLIEEALAEMNTWQFETSVAVNEADLAKLQQLDDVIIHPLSPAEKQQWQQALAPLYEEYERLHTHYYQLLIDQLTLHN